MNCSRGGGEGGGEGGRVNTLLTGVVEVWQPGRQTFAPVLDLRVTMQWERVGAMTVCVYEQVSHRLTLQF